MTGNAPGKSSRRAIVAPMKRKTAQAPGAATRLAVPEHFAPAATRLLSLATRAGRQLQQQLHQRTPSLVSSPR